MNPEEKSEDHGELLYSLFDLLATNGIDVSLYRPSRIILRNLNLSLAGDSNLEELVTAARDLVLTDCEELETVLDWSYPHLRTLKVIRATTSEVVYASVDEFLERGSTLGKLQVSYVMDRDVLGWAHVRRHAASLRLLYVDGLDGDDPGFVNFKQMCAECDKLEQLAMRMPTGEHEVLEFLECVRQLKGLKTLRLFSYPEARAQASNNRNHLTPRPRLLDMQETANTLFNVLCGTCPLLTGLVIDSRECHEDCRSKTVKRFGFLRARQIDLCGRTKAVGMLIEPHMIKHHEPCSEIFEDDFGPVKVRS